MTLPSANPEIAGAASSPKPTVLVVDDDSPMRSLFEIYVSSFGYRPLLARNGEEAVQLAQSHPEICVMIMDVIMPGLSGRDLAEKVRAELPQVGILFCSGHPARVLKTQGIDLSLGRFLQKPCRPPDLKREVQELVAEYQANRA